MRTISVWCGLLILPTCCHAELQFYVTDYLESQEVTIKPLGAKPSTIAQLFATPGEYEPVSFAVRPTERVEEVFIRSGDLAGQGGAPGGGAVGVIPKENVRVQSVEGLHGGDHNILMDLGHPWDMPAYQRELFWVTVHVPENAKPGVYKGKVTVTGADKPLGHLTLEVEVLPLTLEDPPFALGFNYSSPKLAATLAAHLKDMKEHGMTTVAPLYNFHLPVHDEDTKEMGDFIEAYKAAGFKQPLYFGASMNLVSELAGYGPVDSKRFQRKYLKVMRRLHAEAQRHEVPVLFSIADELTNQALPGIKKGELLARLCYEELPEMAVTSDMNGYLEVMTMAPFLNVATFNNGWDGIDHHNKGRRLMSREFLEELQQKTDAIPWFVNAGSGRFPFGFFFWKMTKYGLKGKVEWYYNLGNNERGSAVRVEKERVWPTLAYERSREGIDDLKYLCKLETLIAQARKAAKAATEAQQAADLLKRISESILDNWTAYTSGGETFPADGFDVMDPEKAARMGRYQSLRKAIADEAVRLQEAME